MEERQDSPINKRPIKVTPSTNWFTLYRQNDCKPVLCRGYSPRLNPQKNYKKAKEPITVGFTAKIYSGPTDAEIEKHISDGGWVGWVLPEGVLVLDYDDGTDDEMLIEKTFLRARIEPGIMRTNNGKQGIFKDPGGISGIEQYCTIGPRVCYRIGGKNQCIWPPVNGRACEVWQDFADLPALPHELYPASTFHDNLNALSWQIGKKYRQGLIQGNDDLDLSFMAYLVNLNLSQDEAVNSFSTVFGSEFDRNRTIKLYERAVERVNNGEPLRGAGSFIQAIKDKGLDDIAGITAKIDRLLKGNEEKQPVNILSQLYTWNEIADLDVSVEWLLDGLIPKGAITLVFCPGGGGKTWLMMQLARAIATGEPFGELQTIQTPVYFIDFENPLSVVKERRLKIGPATDFYYWHLSCPTGPRKLDGTDWEDYKQLPPGLIIFDTLRASHSGDENSSKDMALVLSRLKELREAGFTIVILHHTPKGNDGTYKGSTAILDLADHVLSLEKQSKKDDDEFDPDAIYKFGCRIKTRFEPNSVFFSFDPEIGFTPREDPDIKTMQKMADILKKEGKPLNQKEFKELLEKILEMKKARIFKLLKKGTGTFWKHEKGDHNSNVYSCLPSVFQCSALIKGRKTQETETDNFLGNGKHKEEIDAKTVDDAKFASLPEANEKTEKQDFNEDPDFIAELEEDKPRDQLQDYIAHYLNQGLTQADAIVAAKLEFEGGSL
jgi:archaellum biogenesis ATPase FlaH